VEIRVKSTLLAEFQNRNLLLNFYGATNQMRRMETGEMRFLIAIAG
jgi:hypothetical protein